MDYNITLPKLEDNGEFIPFDKEGFLDIPYKTRGLYFLYDRYYNIIYIGKSIDIGTRLSQHASGNSNTSEFSDIFKFFKYIEITNPATQDIYETYYIDMYRPIANKDKNIFALESKRSKESISAKIKPPTVRKQCGRCSKEISITAFYVSPNKYDSHGKMSVCKRCLQNIYIEKISEGQDYIESIYNICKLFNIFFDKNTANTCIESHYLDKGKIISSYITIINSLPQYKGLVFREKDSWNEAI